MSALGPPSGEQQTLNVPDRANRLIGTSKGGMIFLGIVIPCFRFVARPSIAPTISGILCIANSVSRAVSSVRDGQRNSLPSGGRDAFRETAGGCSPNI
jgi:hypothetical protein